jgi:hypothetical protein
MEAIDVICIVFPDGVTYFTPAEGFKPDTAPRIMDAWKAQLSPERRQRYIDAGAMGGFLWMHMLKADYDRIPATTLSHALTEAVKGGA